MVTKQQEYLSGILKTVGLGLWAPVSSILFQWFIFEKCPYFGHFAITLIVSLLGIIVMYLGYKILGDK